MTTIESIIKYYCDNRDIFNNLDWKTDYESLLNIVGRDGLISIIYNTYYTNEPLSEYKNLPQVKAKKVKVNKDGYTFSKYKLLVKNITKVQEKLLPNYELYVTNKFKYNNHKGTYSIDHKISIKFGWKHNIPVELIGSVENLRVITTEENRIKNIKNYIDEQNRHILKFYNE